MYPLIGGLLGVLSATGIALAHNSGGPDQASPWLAWTADPEAVICLATAFIWYQLGVWRLSREAGIGRVLTRSRIAVYVAGLAVLVVTLLSPVDTIGDDVFWLHMVQHLLLTLVAPPLLVWSRPAVVFIWAFPRPIRRRIARSWNGVGLGATVRGLQAPAMAWLLFTGTFLVWHVPGPFQFALDHEAVHEAEHLSFFLTALLFWSVVIAPSTRGRLDCGARLLLLLTNGVLTGFPGALMILSPRVLYPIQALRSPEWGLTGLEDQQIAGAVMWIVGGLLYLGVGSWLFVRWLDDAEKPTRASVHRGASLASALVLTLLLFGCGKSDESQERRADLQTVQGDPDNGAQVIRDIGCGSCHLIPGIRTATGVVGPPLNGIGRRVFLAGILPNTPDNMVRWLRVPQEVIPHNGMPNTGLSETDARDVAAYLARAE